MHTCSKIMHAHIQYINIEMLCAHVHINILVFDKIIQYMCVYTRVVPSLNMKKRLFLCLICCLLLQPTFCLQPLPCPPSDNRRNRLLTINLSNQLLHLPSRQHNSQRLFTQNTIARLCVPRCEQRRTA